MGRQRIILLLLLVGSLLGLMAWRAYSEYHLIDSSYLFGSPPQDIMTALVPKEVDPALIRPPAILPDDPVRYGNATSVLSVIQYGDYQCDPCRQASKAIQQVLPTYGGAVRYIWHDLPLTELHPHAMEAAIFARCAGAQGQFWEAHDALLDLDDMSESGFETLTQRLHLNSEQMLTCRHQPTTQAAIQSDVDQAKSQGINGTPFIFVGTKGALGSLTADELRAKIADFAKP